MLASSAMYSSLPATEQHDREDSGGGRQDGQDAPQWRKICAPYSVAANTQARVAANALVFGYFGALEQWYLDGGIHPIARYVEEGMRPLRSIWSKPNEPDSS